MHTEETICSGKTGKWKSCKMKNISYGESGQKKMFSLRIQAAFNEDLVK